jgi:5-formyltetrahydrofolate cyclo-ligase
VEICARGHLCALPVVARRRAPLIFRRWAPETALVPGAHGEGVPPECAEEVVPDLVIVPGLAFDRDGFRLGYGAGYYDRTLAALRTSRPVAAVGLAYAEQLIGHVPRGERDEPLDWIVTERETIRCRR